ncbi:uncharacterized protein LOC118579140 [Onychomys torridus]|uniref:uncharacterized protein LOC118579140 n=1 Tax=Onychomys torridus TaxID=38674 RepID=UPI00167F9491|nr:uncharacterized protein LOC118579140 [Onychomys torridus]
MLWNPGHRRSLQRLNPVTAGDHQILTEQKRREPPAASHIRARDQSALYPPRPAGPGSAPLNPSADASPGLGGTASPCNPLQLPPLDLFAVWACCSLDSSQEALTPKSIYGGRGLQGGPPKVPDMRCKTGLAVGVQKDL